MAKKLALTISLLFLISLNGCTSPTDVSEPQPTVTLFPYVSPSPIPTSHEPTRAAETTIIPTSGPTATPFLHIVRQDDTLLGIAYRYGVSMDDLLAANPGIDPRILSIDQEIIIPIAEGDPATNFIPSATPVPMQLSEVACYPNQSQGMWCIVTLENNNENDLEAVSAVISLLDEAGNNLNAKTAYSPLNLIPVGAKVPLAVYFPEFTEQYAYAIVSPVSAFPARSISGRYIKCEVVRDVDQSSEDLLSWHIEGRLLSKESQGGPTAQMTVLVIAMDEIGKVIGFRQIRLSDQIGAGDELLFETDVFSLGPIIHSVEIYAEGIALGEEE